MAKNWRGFLGIEGFSLRGDSVRGSDDSNQPRGRHLRRRNRRSSRSSSIPDENILAPDDSTYSNDSRRGASEERHHNGSGARLHPLIPSHGELSRVEEPSSAIVRRPVATSISRGNETSDPRSDQWEVQQKLVSASDHEQTYQREVQRYVDAVGSFNALRRFIEFHKIKIAKLSSIIERTPKAEHDECIKAALDKGDLETALHRFIEELMGNYNSTEIRVAAIQKAVRDLAQGLPIAVASQNRQQMRSAELHSLPTQVRDDIEKLIIQRQLYDSMNAKIRSNALELADPSVAKEQQRDGIEDLLDSFIAETRRMRADFQAQSNLNGRLQTDLSSLQLELMDYRDALMKANHDLAQANHDLMQANHDLKVQDEKWQAHWERETGKHKADLNREMSKHKADLDNARRVYEEKMRKRQSEHASEVAREKERLEKLHVQLEEQMSHHQQQLSERQREHHQAVEKERRAATEKEDKLKRDNEAFRSVLVARQHMKGLSDPEIATRFKRLLNLIDQFSRISWEKKKENQWPVTDSALRRTENARKMKKQIVQCCIWTMLNEKIFESPFKVFREEGAALHEDWAGHDSQGTYGL